MKAVQTVSPQMDAFQLDASRRPINVNINLSLSINSHSMKRPNICE